jgi:hypothetical protein
MTKTCRTREQWSSGINRFMNGNSPNGRKMVERYIRIRKDQKGANA